MAQELNTKLFKKMGWEYNKELTLNPLKVTSIVDDPNTSTISEDILNDILKLERVRTKDDLIERRLSLPTTSFLKSKSNQKKIDSFKL